MTEEKTGEEVTIRPEDLGKPGATKLANGRFSKDQTDDGED